MAKSRNFQRRERNGVRKFWYIFIMVLLATIYICGQNFCNWEWLTEVFVTTIAIISAVAFWLEYRENKLLNEAQFIMELNGQFISNAKLSDVEWELEKYYNRYCKNEMTEEYEEEFEKMFALEKRERQHLVNYLVHLEGIATLVNNGVIHLYAIDDLMSYRYFVAVNNPIVQKMELLEFPDYYKGCIGIYDAWVDELLRQKITPPMYHKKGNNLTKKYKEKEDD